LDPRLDIFYEHKRERMVIAPEFRRVVEGVPRVLVVVPRVLREVEVRGI
jgi:hypothetical protein